MTHGCQRKWNQLAEDSQSSQSALEENALCCESEIYPSGEVDDDKNSSCTCALACQQTVTLSCFGRTTLNAIWTCDSFLIAVATLMMILAVI